MTNRKHLALVVIAALIVLPAYAMSQTGDKSEKKEAPKGETVEKKTAKKDDAKKPPITYKVQKKPFKIELSLKGTLEPNETAEVVFRPQASPGGPFGGLPLTIRSAVEHGTKVRAGDIIISLDTQRIDQIIEDIQTDLKVTEASVKLTEEEIVLLKKAVPLDLASAERDDKVARENLKYFFDISKGETEKRAHNYVKSAKFYLEFAQEELRQLEKMYKANDLTEETEQIILKRQRHYVDMAKNYYKEAEIQRDYMLKVELPRRESSLKETVEREAILLEKARATLAPLVNHRQQALTKLRHEFDKNKHRLQELQKDRQAMTLLAPRDGIVYYGKFAKGQWEGASAMANRLTPHANVMPNDVLVTIVKPRPLSVRLQVEEKDVMLIKPGLEAKAKPTFNLDLRIAGKVTKVSSVPSAPGKFEAMLALEIPTVAENLMPGMACEVKLVPYSQKSAIVVPAKSVVEEDDKYYVHIVSKKGKQDKREVRPGRTSGDQTEIIEGLREGEEILPDAPADKTKPMGAAKGGTP